MTTITDSTPSSAAAGWITFAGTIMIVVGIFQAFIGLVGILDDNFYVVAPEYVVQLDTTTWGWIHLVIGLIVVASGFGVFSGNILARTVGVLAAMGSMISAFFWIPWYPIWGIIVVAVNIAVIWALTVHGRDLAELG
ncbi:MAG TPA: hypothetical protein VL068_06930 [Microthrixaceae bacterium]|nr:hypothetical protein [Microthrixaceae bacterium]